MSNATAGAPEVHIQMLVRDKDGKPKFSDPSLIKHFIHRLTEDEINYLKEKYGNDYLCFDNPRS